MYKHSFLDYLELIENCRNSEDELFYLNTEVELRNFRKNGVWRCGKVNFKFPNLNEVKYTRKRDKNGFYN